MEFRYPEQIRPSAAGSVREPGGVSGAVAPNATKIQEGRSVTEPVVTACRVARR
jgi:hypothetical protein